MVRKPSHLNSQSTISKVTGGQRLRVFERAAIGGQVLIHDETHLFIAPLTNISAGGLFVGQLVSIPEGKVVRIVVKSPKLENPVQATATVVRVQHNGVRGLAIEFTSISSRAREVIQNCVYEVRMESALRAA